jgi:hypothetical protein
VSQGVVKIRMNLHLFKRQGIQCIAKQLLASQEGLFSLILIDVHSNVFGIYT